MAWQNKSFVAITTLLVVVTVLTICALLLETLQLDWRQLSPQRLRGQDSQSNGLDIPSQFVTVKQEDIATGDERVSLADSLHLSLLHEICLDSKDSIVPWQYGAPREGLDQDTREDRNLLIDRSDPELLSKLQECPDIDIFLPSGLRGHGYCEDGVAYTKYLKSRLLPGWVFSEKFYDPVKKSNVTYYDICPKTPVIYFNHYWDGVAELSKDKPLYLMPNIEMYELRETHLWRADVVLCKTLSCQHRVTQWYKQEGNPRHTQVIYTKHTTSDVARFARHRVKKDDADAAIKAKDFDNVRFVHAAGGSGWKGTREVLQCWLSRPDLPSLDLHLDKGNFNGMFNTATANRIRKSFNINVTLQGMKAVEFGRMMAESAFFLCPSTMEGYGHYINQARAAGGLILTTQASPMNELVSSTDMGVYVRTQTKFNQDTFLGGRFRGKHGLRNVEGIVASFSADDLCSSVDQIVAMSVQSRKAKAEKIKQQYHLDTKFFAATMRKLSEFARGVSGNSVRKD